MADHKIRTHFFAGLLALAPLFLTLIIVLHLVRMADAFIVNPVFQLLPLKEGHPFKVLLTKTAIAGVVAAFIVLVGLLAEIFIFRKFLAFCESCFKTIPLFNKVYVSIKEVAAAFFGDKKGVFKRVVFIEYPRKGIYSMGFLTQDRRWEMHEKTGKELHTVFVPSPPNPATGFFVFVPQEELIYADMTVEEGIKFVVSGGTALPPPKK